MRIFEYQRVVEWGECDPARIIFFPNYFRWMEEGLSAMARAHGVALQPRIGPDMIAGTPAVSIAARFMAPARLGDTVRHVVEVAEVRTRAFRITHRFWREDLLLMEAEDVRAWCEITFGDDDTHLSAKSLPEDVRAMLAG
jgi:acyl-CoA thioesterase FadM